MPDIGLDLGLLAAYVIPGFLLLRFLPKSGTLKVLLQGDEEPLLPPLLTALCLSIFLSMLVGVFRSGTLDLSFKVAVPWVNVEKSPHFGSIQTADFEYEKLISPDVRKAFAKAETDQKRKYQFYGNSLLVILLLSVFALPKSTLLNQASWQRRLTGGLLVIIVAIFLYSACRISFYRYHQAVIQIQETAPLSGE